jgi:hypothetical protein
MSNADIQLVLTADLENAICRRRTAECPKSLVFGKFPCIGLVRGEIASIPVPGNAPWFGGKPLVRNADCTDM